MRQLISIFLLLATIIGGGISARIIWERYTKTSSLAVYPGDIQGCPNIRILVQTKIKDAALQVTGPYELFGKNKNDPLIRIGGGSEAVDITVLPHADGLLLGQTVAPFTYVAIKPVKNCRILVNQKDYGGDIAFYKEESTANAPPLLSVLVLLNLEEYLLGVVPSEMPASWPMAALQSQAVASRSYALYKMKTRAHLPFDVYSTTASQVWRPNEVNNPVVTMAVNSTRGMVVTDQYRLFPAYFSSRCGGFTKDGVNVFISHHIAPLTGVQCPYCLHTVTDPQIKWSFTLIVEELARKLKEKGYPIGSITRIYPLDDQHRQMTSPGRVYDLGIEHSLLKNTGILIIPAERFRQLVGGGKQQLASSYFSVKIRDGEAIFEGRGFGHGVGFCQYGSRYLAQEEKYDFRDILNHYYHGHIIARFW